MLLRKKWTSRCKTGLLFFIIFIRGVCRQLRISLTSISRNLSNLLKSRHELTARQIAIIEALAYLENIKEVKIYVISSVKQGKAVKNTEYITMINSNTIYVAI